MRQTTYPFDAVLDAVREAARDVLLPLIEAGTFTGSTFDVSELATGIERRFHELMGGIAYPPSEVRGERWQTRATPSLMADRRAAVKAVADGGAISAGEATRALQDAGLVNGVRDPNLCARQLLTDTRYFERVGGGSGRPLRYQAKAGW